MNILIVNLFENKTLKNINRYKELKTNVDKVNFLIFLFLFKL